MFSVHRGELGNEKGESFPAKITKVKKEPLKEISKGKTGGRGSRKKKREREKMVDWELLTLAKKPTVPVNPNQLITIKRTAGREDGLEEKSNCQGIKGEGRKKKG